MNLQALLTSFLSGKAGAKIFGPIGRKFGLSPEQTGTIIMIGVPILFKFLTRNKAKKTTLKGRIR